MGERPGWQAIIPVAGAYLIIRNSSAGYVKTFLSNKVLVSLGLVSYPLYIWHWPLLAFLKSTELNPSFLQKIVAITVACILAIATYFYVEKPIRKMQYKSRAALVLLALMIFTGLAGLYTRSRDGFDFRGVNYVVYKAEIQQKIATSLGFQSKKEEISTFGFLDQAKFEKLDPGYTGNLLKLIKTLQSNPEAKKVQLGIILI